MSAVALYGYLAEAFGEDSNREILYDGIDECLSILSLIGDEKSNRKVAGGWDKTLFDCCGGTVGVRGGDVYYARSYCESGTLDPEGVAEVLLSWLEDDAHLDDEESFCRMFAGSERCDDSAPISGCGEGSFLRRIAFPVADALRVRTVGEAARMLEAEIRKIVEVFDEGRAEAERRFLSALRAGKISTSNKKGESVKTNEANGDGAAKSEKKPKIAILVRGGVVQAVVGDSPVEVAVYDMDGGDDEAEKGWEKAEERFPLCLY